jgi:hypothetical protein
MKAEPITEIIRSGLRLDGDMVRLLKEYGINARINPRTKTVETVSDMDFLRLAASRAELEDRQHNLRLQRAALDEIASETKDHTIHVYTDPKEAEVKGKWSEENLRKEMEKRMEHIKLEPEKSEPASEQFNTNLGTTLVKKTEEGLKKQEELVERVADAKKALELSVSTIRRDSLDYLDELDKTLLRMRQARMALDTESKHILTQLKDVRQFFLSEQHADEAKRLREFAETLEKLKAFKESGFLDAVTDTILKLGVK